MQASKLSSFQSWPAIHPRSTKWLTAILLLSGAVASNAQISCGGDGQVACNGDHDPYFGMYYNQGPYNPNHPAQQTPPYWFSNNACDLALNPTNGICHGDLASLNGKTPNQGGARHQIGLSKNTPWITFAMREQRFGIPSDQAVNWINIFGTHNSFSNYQDGAFDVNVPGTDMHLNFNVDQAWSMFDQMDMGARVIRLDPISYDVVYNDYTGYDTELRMCHQSAKSFTGTGAECDLTSFGRLFSYGLAEVREWLSVNPGEILVMRLNRVQDGDKDKIDAALFEELESLGYFILPPPGSTYGDFWDPSVKGWPTLRQMRAMNKRLIVFSDNGTHLFTYPWSWVTNDGYTDTTGFGLCKNTPSGNTPAIDVRNRAFNLWSYIGEDRSGSNSQNTVPQPSETGGAGLMGTGEVYHATNCGFGLVNVDFLGAPSWPAHNETPISVGFLDWGFTLPTYDFRFGSSTDTDTRREAAIWSWDQDDFGLLGPAFLKSNGRWSSRSATDALRFACAVNPGNSALPANYGWVITSKSDQWSNGPQRCQEIGGTFWAPQSAVENQRLISVVYDQADQAAVWLNYKAFSNPILEPTSAGLAQGSVQNEFVINVTRGLSAAALSPVFQFTGGVGGSLSLDLQSTNKAVFGSSIIDSPTKTIRFTPDANAVDINGNVRLPVGSFTENYTLTERLENPVSTQNVSVTVNVASMGTVKFITQPSGLNLVVDGATYKTPVEFVWGQEQHTVTVPTQDGTPGVRYSFANWSDGSGFATRQFTGSIKDVAFTANMATSYLVTVGVTPSESGKVNGAGWFPSNKLVTLSAVPRSGFKFVSYGGDIRSADANLSFHVDKATNVTATFAAINPPVLYASSGARVDLGNGVVSVPIVLTDVGTGPAGDATVASITDFTTLTGTGVVSANIPNGGVLAGTLLPGQTGQAVIQFAWPKTATRVQFTVHYTANGGAFQGANTISLFR